MFGFVESANRTYPRPIERDGTVTIYPYTLTLEVGPQTQLQSYTTNPLFYPSACLKLINHLLILCRRICTPHPLSCFYSCFGRTLYCSFVVPFHLSIYCPFVVPFHLSQTEPHLRKVINKHFTNFTSSCTIKKEIKDKPHDI